MDTLHENSIVAIAGLQKQFQMQSDVMFKLSMIFDPRYAFLVLAPLFFSLDRYTGRKLMWTTVIAEWSNMILKWILRGERPYWWINESKAASVLQGTPNKLPLVEQFFLTCETGPGSPSGHAMVTAAVWYIIFESVLRNRGTLSKQCASNRILWSLYTIILGAVSLSRVYIAAHFPHQCIMGMAIGIAVAMLMSHLDTDRAERKHYLYGTAFLLGSTLLTYAVIRSMGINPSWSVDRAVKWCAKKEHIHLDTTPFFSLMRFSGFFLGMGLALHSKPYRFASKHAFTTTMKVVSAILACGICKLSERLPLVRFNDFTVYSSAFALNAILPYIYIAIIPQLIVKVWYALHRRNVRA